MRFAARPKTLLRITLALLSTVFSIAAVEVVLRVQERCCFADAPDYPDTWRQGDLGLGGFLKENFDAQVQDGYGGTVRWTNNRHGFRSDRDFDRTPPPGVLRILSMGDSFTAGYRVGQEGTYSRKLEVWSNREVGATEVLVACTEAPRHSLRYLETYGASWLPHLVLMGLTLGNDMAQTYADLHPEVIGFNQGLEVVNLPSRCIRGPRPTPSRLYEFRVISRLVPFNPGITSWYGRTTPKLFDITSGLGFFIKDPPEQIETAFSRTFRLMRGLRDFCRERNLLLAVLMFPQRFQVQPADWEATIRDYNLNRDQFDLEIPNRSIRSFCRKEGLLCIDPTKEMLSLYEKSGVEMYLPRGDMHWNSEGHRAFFESTIEELKPLVATAKALVED